MSLGGDEDKGENQLGWWTTISRGAGEHCPDAHTPFRDPPAFVFSRNKAKLGFLGKGKDGGIEKVDRTNSPSGVGHCRAADKCSQHNDNMS